MKKIIGIFLMFALVVATATAQRTEQTVSYPFGTATTETATLSTVTKAITVNNLVTYCTYTLDTNVTFTTSVVRALRARVGMELYLELTASDLNRDVVFSTGFKTDSFVIKSGATRFLKFVFDGTYFNPVSADLPTGLVLDWQSTTASLSKALTVISNFTYVDIGTMDTNMTLTATINNNVKQGAILVIETTANGSNRTVTFSTGLTCTALTNTASKTFLTAFIYNGTVFKAFAQKQID